MPMVRSRQLSSLSLPRAPSAKAPRACWIGSGGGGSCGSDAFASDSMFCKSCGGFSRCCSSVCPSARAVSAVVYTCVRKPCLVPCFVSKATERQIVPVIGSVLSKWVRGTEAMILQHCMRGGILSALNASHIAHLGCSMKSYAKGLIHGGSH